MLNWSIDDFPVDIDPEYFRDDAEENLDRGELDDSEWWKDDDIPF